MSSCVCKIASKSVQVCGCCCKMFRGLTFLGTVYYYNCYEPKNKPNDLDKTSEVRWQNHEMWCDRQPTVDVKMFHINRDVRMWRIQRIVTINTTRHRQIWIRISCTLNLNIIRRSVRYCSRNFTHYNIATSNLV